MQGRLESEWGLNFWAHSHHSLPSLCGAPWDWVQVVICLIVFAVLHSTDLSYDHPLPLNTLHCVSSRLGMAKDILEPKGKLNLSLVVCIRVVQGHFPIQWWLVILVEEPFRNNSVASMLTHLVSWREGARPEVTSCEECFLWCSAPGRMWRGEEKQSLECV